MKELPEKLDFEKTREANYEVLVIYDKINEILDYLESQTNSPCVDIQAEEGMTQKELLIYERGFEDGYATAKRVYRPVFTGYMNEAGEIINPKKK